MMEWMSKTLSFLDGFTTTTWLCTLVLTALVMALWRTASNPGRCLPPGPYSLPLVGHFFKLTNKPHLYYEDLRKKYGDIFSLFLGTRYTVVISGQKLLKEMSLLDEFTGKPPGIFEISSEYKHLIDLNHEDWKEQRRFLIKVFRNLGMGRSDGETAVQTQIGGFLEQIRAASKEDDPKGVSIRDFLFPAVSSIIFTLICNRTFQDDKNVTDMLKEFNNLSNSYFFFMAKMYFLPWMKPLILFQRSGMRQTYEKALKKLEVLVAKEVERHEKNYTGVENLDYIDYYIEQLRQPGIHKSFKRENMFGNSEVFLLAGSDTIRLLMEWYILELTKHQDMQERVYQEVMSVIGKERMPTWEDRSKMPFTQAVFLEIQRFKTLLPVNDPRMTLKDVKFAGFDIPANTVVIMNLFSVHNDSELWGDPENFRPERFLTQDGKGINQMEQYVTTFSMGKRNCPGEKMANVHLFLYIIAMLQAFKFVEPRDGFQHSENALFASDLENFRIGFELRE